MAWAVVASTGQGATTTTPINTTGATLIVVVAGQFSGASAPPFSDSAGNAWQTTGFATGGNVGSQLYYCYNPNTSASHTFTRTGPSLFGTIGVIAFSGSVGKGVNDVFAQNISSGGTALNAGSITPTANGDLIISSLAQSGSDFTGLAASSGTIQVNYPLDGFGNAGVAIGWQSQASAGAIDPTWSWTTASTGDVAFNVAFKAGFPATTDYGNGFIITGASATTGPFAFLGGKYGVEVHTAAWNGATVALSILGPDGSTYVPVSSFTADGTAVIDLPSCLVRMTVSVAVPTNVNFSVTPISYRR